MQLYQNPNLQGTLVKKVTGVPTGLLPNAVDKTTAKSTSALWQSGDWADFITQEENMVSTSTTTPLTELHTIDGKIIDWNLMEGTVYPGAFASLIDESIHEKPPTGALTTAVFDVQLDHLMCDGVEELQLPTDKERLFTTPPPTMTNMMNSVLPLERPISPSEFLHKPTSSSSQHQPVDDDFLPELDKLIEEILPNTSADVTWDSSQLDLNLFNHDQPDILQSLLQQSGITEQTEEISIVSPEESQVCIMPTTMPQQIATKEEPPRDQRNTTGPVRVRRERRASKKPARFRHNVYLDEDMDMSTTKDYKNVSVEEAIATTSDSLTLGRIGKCFKEMSNEEKYIRSREQNNLASRRCREKRREKFEKMTSELKTLEDRNKVLKDKVVKLTALRDDFQKFVNNFLFQRMIKK